MNKLQNLSRSPLKQSRLMINENSQIATGGQTNIQSKEGLIYIGDQNDWPSTTDLISDQNQTEPKSVAKGKDNVMMNIKETNDEN